MISINFCNYLTRIVTHLLNFQIKVIEILFILITKQFFSIAK